MSQRSSERFIAKARLEAMGVPHVNRVMGMGLAHTRHHNLQRTYTGQERLEALRKAHEPVWRRVLYGSLAKDGLNAQLGIGKKKKYKVAAQQSV